MRRVCPPWCRRCTARVSEIGEHRSAPWTVVRAPGSAVVVTLVQRADRQHPQVEARVSMPLPGRDDGERVAAGRQFLLGLSRLLDAQVLR
jgi:hypothetical protein